MGLSLLYASIVFMVCAFVVPFMYENRRRALVGDGKSFLGHLLEGHEPYVEETL